MTRLRDRALLWLQDTASDVRYGLRTLRRSPAFTITALLSLALGIGANAGIFSLVDQVLLRVLRGVHEPERLVILSWNGRDLATDYGGPPLMSYPVCRELQAQDQIFDGVFCRHPTMVYLSTGVRHDRVAAELVTGSYFSVLGVRPALGRLLDPSDDRAPGAHPVVVLSYDYWQAQLGGRADVIGQRVVINNHPMTVVGITPPTFRGVDLAAVPAVWIPVMMKRQATPDWDRLLDRRAAWLHVFGRLKPDVGATQASAALQPWFQSMLEADRGAGATFVLPEQLRQFLASTIEVLPASQGRSFLRDGLTAPLRLLMGGTVLLLLLTASNVAGLLLARGASRARELTTRMALGATQGRVTRQLLVESLLITIGGGVLGLVAAPLVSRLLLSFIAREADLRAAVDHRVFLFALLVCLVTGGVCALAPVLQMRRLTLSERAQIRAVGGVRFRKTLVIGQMAFTLILLTGAGLFVQTVARLQAKAPVAASRVILAGVDPHAIGYEPPRARQFLYDVQRALQVGEGVEQAAVANISLLTGGSFSRPLTIQADRRIVSATNVWALRVGPGFFATLGTRVLAGREFDERDTVDADGSAADYRTVIVNESFARRYFGGRNPVGHFVGLGIRPDTATNIEIVGLTEDLSTRSLRLTESEHIFFPFWDREAERGAVFYVRARGERDAAAASIRAAVAALDPRVPVTELTTFDDQITRSLTNERMLAALSTGFGAVALLMSIVGLYGVMAFVAAQRTREIGVRLALGATRSSAVWLVVRDAVKMVVAGVACAVPVGWALGRIVESQLFGVRPFDGLTIATTGIGLAILALAAAALPAWRAAMLPPMVAIGDQPESMWQAARLTMRRAMRELTSHERSAVPSVTLVGELTNLVRRAGSFPEALDVALAALSTRAGAEFVLLLEKVSKDEFRGGELAIPARGMLMQRLAQYRHPLPLVPGDFHAWLRWAEEYRPQHVGEIERLRDRDVRMAVALRQRHEIVGVLLVGPPVARETFTEADKQVLNSAAEIFALMIENARLNARALEQEKVRRDLALAAEVQRRLLPPQPPANAAVTLAAFTLPARTVGGDYYDFLDLGHGRLGIAVADIAGKGIAAALLMSVVQASLRAITADGEIDAAPLAVKLNRFLYQSTAANHYATFFYAQLDAEGRQLRYVNAGHNPPLLVRRTTDGVEVIELSAGGTVLGLFPEVAFDDGEIELRPGDLVVAFTDGVPEARDASGDEFGEERLKDLLRRSVGTSADDVAATLADHLRTWIADAEQHDDVTVVVAVVNA